MVGEAEQVGGPGVKGDVKITSGHQLADDGIDKELEKNRWYNASSGLGRAENAVNGSLYLLRPLASGDVGCQFTRRAHGSESGPLLLLSPPLRPRFLARTFQPIRGIRSETCMDQTIFQFASVQYCGSLGMAVAWASPTCLPRVITAHRSPFSGAQSVTANPNEPVFSGFQRSATGG